MLSRSYPSHFETSVPIAAEPGAIFEYLDDHERLSDHMMKSSGMMAGGAMHFDYDAGRGKSVGSVIRMSGRILGMSLSVEEAVIERAPPQRKIWETCGIPRLIVIGHYRMGFEVTPTRQDCSLRIFIDYEPPSGPLRLLGLLAGGWYARWCVRSMANGAAGYFSRNVGP